MHLVLGLEDRLEDGQVVRRPRGHHQSLNPLFEQGEVLDWRE